MGRRYGYVSSKLRTYRRHSSNLPHPLLGYAESRSRYFRGLFSPLLSPFPRLFLFQITTFYNKEQSTTDCFAMADYLPGDQVFIYYGNRPNSMFLQYQGFIYKPNQNDCISLHFHLYVSLLSYSSSFYFFSSNTSTRHQLATRR